MDLAQGLCSMAEAWNLARCVTPKQVPFRRRCCPSVIPGWRFLVPRAGPGPGGPGPALLRGLAADAGEACHHKIGSHLNRFNFVNFVDVHVCTPLLYHETFPVAYRQGRDQ